MATGTRLVDRYKAVVGLHAVVPSSASPKWVSTKGYNHITAIITFKNTTTVTGSAIGFLPGDRTFLERQRRRSSSPNTLRASMILLPLS